MKVSSCVRAGAAVLALVLLSAAPVAAQPVDRSARLRAAVTVNGILEHEDAFQAIADAAGGNRLAGAPGYEDSADYVADVARDAGLDVSFHTFGYDLDLLADWTPPVLDVVAGGPTRSFVPGILEGLVGGDFGSMINTQPGDLTAPVWAADVNFGAGGNTSGCEAADYAGMPPGAIVLLQYSEACALGTKFLGAQLLGAGAIVLFYEPGNPTRFLIDVTGLQTPSVTATIPTAEALADGITQGLTGLTARLKVDWRPGTYPTRNVIAETPRGDPNQVVVVGAHLDSVGPGPGINDNGSGSATILEIAEHVQSIVPRATVRFVWFSAEESGLLGSEAYVASLSESERRKVVAMLNFDMVGSPNFVRFVYDGDLSDTPPPPGGAPPGSAEIEQVFLDHFASQGLPVEPTEFSGRSDYGPFIEVGIPAGGLFTGAEGIKTSEEAAVYGGVAGEQYDPCYHLGCDDRDNLSVTALDQMSDAAAHAVAVLAANPRGVLGTDVRRGRGTDLERPQRPPQVPRVLPLLRGGAPLD